MPGTDSSSPCMRGCSIILSFTFSCIQQFVLAFEATLPHVVQPVQRSAPQAPYNRLLPATRQRTSYLNSVTVAISTDTYFQIVWASQLSSSAARSHLECQSSIYSIVTFKSIRQEETSLCQYFIQDYECNLNTAVLPMNRKRRSDLCQAKIGNGTRKN